MDAFLQLSAEERRDACRIAEERILLRAASIEKDFWVCWTLRELFALPEWGPRLTFKGGTSLSKAWAIIDRFSEDIDVVIDRDFLGFGGERSPENAPSKKKQQQWLKDLRDASQARIKDSLQPALAALIAQKMPKTADWKMESDAEDPDGQTILFYYPNVFEAGYVAPRVKIELGARSDTDPAETPEIKPYLFDVHPDVLGPSAFSVRAVAPRRTFWEKAMLLHEETYRPADKKRAARLSRHYYDLWCLIGKGTADQALADADLFERVAAHRRVFFRHSWVDYDTLKPQTLRLLPAEDQKAGWAEDYAQMRENMLFGNPPTFDDILAAVGDFQKKVNAS